MWRRRTCRKREKRHRGTAVAPWPCSSRRAPRAPKSPSACLPTVFSPPYVPPVAAHFEPVSNGGPRTDLPAEECVLLLIHQKARSVCPPVPEVRTARQRGEGRRYRPGRRETCAGRAAERPAGYGAQGGNILGFVCAPTPAALLHGTTKWKRDVEIGEELYNADVIFYPNSTTLF